MGCVQSLLKADGDIEELYTLDKCVGEGVEGQVYLATERETGQQVAIKLVARCVCLYVGLSLSACFQFWEQHAGSILAAAAWQPGSQPRHTLAQVCL